MSMDNISPADIAAVTGNNRNDTFGGDGWWILLLLLAFGGGFGNWGGGNNGFATRADINEGFALNGINTGIQGIQQGICDSTYRLSAQLADCCCQTQRAIDGVNYNMEKNTRAILEYLTQDKITTLQEENQALRFSASQDRQNALLTTAMTAQTNQILGVLNPTPIPAYTVPSPYGYANNYGYGNCGCGCGCN